MELKQTGYQCIGVSWGIFKNTDSEHFMRNQSLAESLLPEPLHLASPLSTPTCHFCFQFRVQRKGIYMEDILLCQVTGWPMELAPLGSTPSPDPTSCRWLTRLVQNTVPYIYLPLFSQQGLCMGQFAWIAKAIVKTSVALGGGGGVQGADYITPNFQLIRNLQIGSQ